MEVLALGDNAEAPALYAPFFQVCEHTDESLLLFKGCAAFKQFITTKTARFGIKFFELCVKVMENYWTSSSTMAIKVNSCSYCQNF